VAAGLCYGSIGTDTGGSIRIPAGLCGIVGIKPGVGRVSVEGIIPLSPRLDVAGPLARTIQDAAILMEPIFLNVKREPRLPARQKSSAKMRKLKLGVPREFLMDVVDDPVRAVFEAALDSFRKQGAQIKDISIPLLRKTEHAGNQIAWAEAAHYHQQSGWYPGHSAEYGEDVRSRLEMGTKVTATAYLEALELRDKFIQEFHRAIADARVDALVVPTLPIGAPPIGEETTRVGGKDYPTRALLLRTNRPANLAGIPAISIPCGLTSDGLPVGLQLIGAVTDEHLLVSIAHVYERDNPEANWPRL
jgi:aspartyl-tRNA(Asn)/glutamyl-tRNA(Gln) amidotransferase subunit A